MFFKYPWFKIIKSVDYLDLFHLKSQKYKIINVHLETIYILLFPKKEINKF